MSRSGSSETHVNSIEVIALAFAVSAGPCGAATLDGNAAEPIIETSDVDRFYEVYDESGGRPTADMLQREYLDPGSSGLHELARLRNVTGQSIAEASQSHEAQKGSAVGLPVPGSRCARPREGR